MVAKSEGGEDSGHHNFIRWSIPADGSIQEEPVEIISEESTEATIRALSGLTEKTPVYIKGNSYTGNGIVESCTPEGQGHRVVIQLVCNQMITVHSSQIDPGVYSVEGFLTEEEEAKILESLTGGSEFPDEAEETTEESAFSIAHGLKEALSPQASALAAMVGVSATKNPVIQ